MITSVTATTTTILYNLTATVEEIVVNVYDSHIRAFKDEAEAAPDVSVTPTGGHTPGHSVVRVRSGRDRLMFAGDAIFPVSFHHPQWHNGFEHDPEEATHVRLRLMRALADTAPG